MSGSVWVGNDSAGKWGGELRYDYQMGDLHLSQGSTTASFAAHSQAIHYDFLWNFLGNEAPIQPFVAAGAGIKIYQGTGTQVVYQPLSNIALLTQAQDLTPMASAGAGLKFKIVPHVNLRARCPRLPYAVSQAGDYAGQRQDSRLAAGLRADGRPVVRILAASRL